MLTRSTRDALHCAVLCCQEFASTIIPERGTILDEFSAHKIPVFVENPKEVVFDRGKVEEATIAKAREWTRKLPPGLHTTCSAHLNRLEGWAMHFTVGLASHQAAFGPCAPLFCQTVVQMYPILVLARSDPASGPYPNIVKLFDTWYGAKADEEERVKMDGLWKELKSLQSKGRRGRLPPALGTDLDP